MARVALVFRTDVHVSDRSPSSWKADYPSEIWSNLEQVGEIARRYKAVAVLDGGDYFHVKAPTRNSHALVEKTARIHQAYPCPTWCIEGNHDISYNNLSSLDRQPLGVLYAAGVFNHLREAVFEDEGVRVRVVGVPYSPTRSLAELQAILKQPGDTYLIAVVHQLASENPPPSVEEFFGEPVFRYADLAVEGGPDAFCFHPDTMVLDWLYRPVPIKLIQNGSALLGRSGPTMVENVHSVRTVSEPLVRLNVEGIPSHLNPGVTVEHPFWVAQGLHCVLPSRMGRRCHPDKPKLSHPCSSCLTAPKPSGVWVPAGKIAKGDYVSVPVPVIPNGAPSSDGLARLLGYYVAEGHVVLNRKREPVAGVGWSFNVTEHGLHEDVRALVKRHFGLTTKQHDNKVSKATQLLAYGRDISDFMRTHGGVHADSKCLSSWIWGQSAADRLDFIVGWLLGDGHIRKGIRRTRSEILGCTVSSTLATQIFFLALSIGLRPYYTIRPPTVQFFNHREGYTSVSPAKEVHILSFYGNDAVLLSRHMGRGIPRPSKTKVAGFFSGGLYYARVKSIERYEYEGPVHNFRSSTGEYVAGLLLVHNCFGHWHRDQGIVQVGSTYFVNQGALSRGALLRENLERTPKVAVLEATPEGLSITAIPIRVAPASEVFDLDKKQRQENEGAEIARFVFKLQESLTVDPDASIEEVLGQLHFARDVRDMALDYLERARQES